jgi:ryanodine receptor 2
LQNKSKQADPVKTSYIPQPLNTGEIELSPELLKFTEHIAAHVHEVWAATRIAEGWKYGPKRNDERKEHPCLVPYSELPETEKEYDRKTAIETLKAIGSLGLRII